SIQELFFARASNPGSSIRLNGPLPPGGIVAPTPDAFEFLPDSTAFRINIGLNDAWYDPATNGQGFFITVFEDIGRIFLAWFTYDTERPPPNVKASLGEPGHRWLTAYGDFAGNQAELEIEVTRGGMFDSGAPIPTQELDGTIMLEFSSCNHGTVTYDIPSIDRHGVIPIQRIALGNVPICEAVTAARATAQ
ncbi:MAG: hypothetical protein ACREO9_07765, partial [Lysobacterales bacterium]